MGNGTMHTTYRCKVRWAALEPHGATSLSTQGRVFQWRESLLMLPTGLLCSTSSVHTCITSHILLKLQQASLQNAK